MSAAAIVSSLLARGVELEVVGDRIRYRPVSALSPEEVQALRQHKPEVLALLTRESVTLDPATVLEVLSEHPDQHDLACLRFEVLAVVREIERGTSTGRLPPRRLVRGRPLADWLDLGEVARLLRVWGSGRGEAAHDR